MNKKNKIVALSLLMFVFLTGCGNKTFLDTTYKFDSVIASLPDGTIVEGTVTSWTDYEDGDQIQVSVNGKTYLLHSSNVALIKED